MNMYYNFKTQQFDNRQPDTDEIAKELISQDPAAQAIYEIHRELGDSIRVAMLKTLYAQIGWKYEEGEQS